LNPYSVNIIGLSNRAHSFNYQFSDEFFARYGKDFIPGGKFEAKIVLHKHDTFIEAEFKINGRASLICDRSLDSFELPMAIDKKMVFKYGAEETELSDEIVLITHETTSLDLGQLMYEFIALEMPMRKLHPRFQQEDDENENEEGKVIYSSSTDSDDSEEEKIDPRWEQLKKLK
jgi:uncharacterized metal-binding protein YceD (DUF177 family)